MKLTLLFTSIAIVSICSQQVIYAAGRTSTKLEELRGERDRHKKQLAQLEPVISYEEAKAGKPISGPPEFVSEATLAMLDRDELLRLREIADITRSIMGLHTRDRRERCELKDLKHRLGIEKEMRELKLTDERERIRSARDDAQMRKLKRILAKHEMTMQDMLEKYSEFEERAEARQRRRASSDSSSSSSDSDGMCVIL